MADCGPVAERNQVQLDAVISKPGRSALDRRITACHEAAHAVMSFRLGFRVDEMALCHSGPDAGFVRIQQEPLLLTPPAQARSPGLMWRLVARDTEQRAMVLLAGPLAEAKLLARPLRAHGNRSDLARCLLFCTALREHGCHLAETQSLTIPVEEPQVMANRLLLRVARILRQPRIWRAVTVLAKDLEGWGSLTGDDAADTVQWTRRVQGQLDLLLPMPH